jgi:hypothetical protein
MSKVTRIQSAVHQLHELRDSSSLTCQNEGGGEGERRGRRQKGIMDQTIYTLNM